MLRVALVRAFSTSSYKEPCEPLGIEALAAVLRLHGIDCKLFDRELHSLGSVVDSLVAYRPDLLGLSVLMEDNAPDALRVLTMVRRKLSTFCFAGGMFITTSYEKARALFPADCELIAGEGEAAILRLCSRFTGIKYPGMERQQFSPEQWPWMYRPHLEAYLAQGAPINMKTSRGCPGRCRFCATPSLPYGLDKWQGRRIVDVADEMQALCEKYSPHSFNFVDDDFGPISRVEELVAELEKRGLRCALSLQLRADAVCRTKDLAVRMAALKAGGLSRVFIGLESFDREALAYFGKNLDPVKALEAFQVIRNAGIAIHIGYILWHPLSTPESVRREARQLWEAGFFTTKIVMARLQMFPGCQLTGEGDLGKFAAPMERYFEAVSQKIAPLYDAWLVGAIWVPYLYCLAFLTPDGDAAHNVVRMEEQLARLDALSYQLLQNPESIDEATILKTAAEVKESLYAAGSSSHGSR